MRKYVLIANRQKDILFQYSDFKYNDNLGLLLFDYSKTRIRVLRLIDSFGLKDTRISYHSYFKGIFDKTINQQIEKSEEIEYVFIVMARVYEKYGNSLVNYLRANYPSSSIVLYIVDLIANMRFKLSEAKMTFDVVCSFDEKEAEINGINYVLEPFSVRNLKNIIRTSNPECDVSFVGAAKGRYDKIIWLYNYLTKKGLKCEFYIVGVKKKEQIKSEGLHYKWLDFEEVLELAARSRCIVEIMQKNGYSATTRYAEAVALRKNLLTDCPALQYAEEKSIIWFDKGSELSIKMICNDNGNELDRFIQMFSIDSFIENIDKHLYADELHQLKR